MYDERRTVRYTNRVTGEDIILEDYEMSADPKGKVWNKKTGRELKISKWEGYFFIDSQQKHRGFGKSALLASTFPEIYKPAEKNGEKWVPLKYYAGDFSEEERDFIEKHFDITRVGDVRNAVTGVELKQSINSKGYYYIGCKWNGKKNHLFIHSAVAYMFAPNPNNFTVINHKDGNKLNNRWDNLEFGTQKHNIRHSYANGLQKSYLYGYKIKCVETGEIFDFATDAIKKYGMNPSSLYQYLQHKLNKKGSRYSYYSQSCGKHPITGEPLHWVLVDEAGNEYTPEEFAKMKEQKALEAEMNGDKEKE